MRKKNNTGRNLAVGAAVAGAVGYLAGILTAPKSGKETREDIADKAGDIKESAIMQLEDLKDELSDLLDMTKKKTVALSGKAREEYNEAVIMAKDAQNKAVYVLKAVKKGQADDPELNKAIKQAKLAKKNLAKFLKS